MMGAIAGVLSSRSVVAPAYIYFTSALYPFAVRDEIAAGNTELTTGRLWGLATENIDASATLMSGTLVATIVYVDYTMETENISASATLQSGTLETTINYVESTFSIENITASASLQSGTLI